MSATEKIRELADKIPGYAGYRDLESRRASDRALRESTANAFRSQISRLARVQEQAINRGNLDDVETFDAIIGQMQHLVDRLRTAPEGYGGLFGDAPVQAETLDRLYDFDLGFAKGIEKIADQIAQMGGITPAAEVLPGLMQTLDELHAQFDERQALLERPHDLRPASPGATASPAHEPPYPTGGETQAWTPPASVKPVETPVAVPEEVGRLEQEWSPSQAATPDYVPPIASAPATGDAPDALEPPAAHTPASIDELNDPAPVTLNEPDSGTLPTPSDSAAREWSPADAANVPDEADDESNVQNDPDTWR